MDSVLLAGFPLMALVMAIVQYVKRLGVTGNWLTACSLAVGLVAGVVQRYSVAPLVSFQDWLGAVVFGLVIGFVASGLWDGGKELAGKNKPTDTGASPAELSQK